MLQVRLGVARECNCDQAAVAVALGPKAFTAKPFKPQRLSGDQSL